MAFLRGFVEPVCCRFGSDHILAQFFRIELHAIRPQHEAKSAGPRSGERSGRRDSMERASRLNTHFETDPLELSQ